MSDRLMNMRFMRRAVPESKSKAPTTSASNPSATTPNKNKTRSSITSPQSARSTKTRDGQTAPSSGATTPGYPNQTLPLGGSGISQFGAEDERWILSFIPPAPRSKISTPKAKGLSSRSRSIGLQYSNVVSVGFNDLGKDDSSDDDEDQIDENSQTEGDDHEHESVVPGFRVPIGRRTYGAPPPKDKKSGSVVGEDDENNDESGASGLDSDTSSHPGSGPDSETDEPPRKRTRRGDDTVSTTTIRSLPSSQPPQKPKQNQRVRNDTDFTLDEMPLSAGSGFHARSDTRPQKRGREMDADFLSLRGVKSISGGGNSLSRQVGAANTSTMECFRCGKVGHMAKMCSSGGNGNGNGGGDGGGAVQRSKPRSRKG